MNTTIRDRAISPAQYDGEEIQWQEEGAGLSPIRRLFMESLEPFIDDVDGVASLDVGCGQGWLVYELYQRRAQALGIDPSAKNIAAAQSLYPAAEFQHTTLEDFESHQTFGLVTALMVFEHFPDVDKNMERVHALMSKGAKFLLIAGDFDRFTQPRFNYTVETEVIRPGEVVTRTDYGDRAGVIYDINRTPELFIEAAAANGLSLVAHQPIMAADWLIEEQPRYREGASRPLFQLFEFQAD